MKQITLDDLQKYIFYDRSGRTKKCPEWVDEERCGNCQNWTILPEYDQPPNGWGVRGLCGRTQNRYTVSQTSWCQKYEEKRWDG